MPDPETPPGGREADAAANAAAEVNKSRTTLVYAIIGLVAVGGFIAWRMGIFDFVGAASKAAEAVAEAITAVKDGALWLADKLGPIVEGLIDVVMFVGNWIAKLGGFVISAANAVINIASSVVSAIGSLF